MGTHKAGLCQDCGKWELIFSDKIVVQQTGKVIPIPKQGICHHPVLQQQVVVEKYDRYSHEEKATIFTDAEFGCINFSDEPNPYLVDLSSELEEDDYDDDEEENEN